MRALYARRQKRSHASICIPAVVPVGTTYKGENSVKLKVGHRARAVAGGTATGRTPRQFVNSVSCSSSIIQRNSQSTPPLLFPLPSLSFLFFVSGSTLQFINFTELTPASWTGSPSQIGHTYLTRVSHRSTSVAPGGERAIALRCCEPP